MENDSKQEAYNFLSNMATQQGYVTFDDIMDVAEKFQLLDAEIDWLSDQLSMWGISICEKHLNEISDEEETDEYSDYAQVDYDAIFSKIIKLKPSLLSLINTVKKIRPPQFKEVSDLIWKAKKGDSKARERILTMHLRCAIRIGLRRAELYETDIEECIGDAFEGLVKALDKYDPYSFKPFISYASMWIFQSLSRNQSNQRPLIHHPAHKKERYFTAFSVLKNKGCTQCDKKLSCTKIVKIICEKLNYSEENVNEIILQTLPLYSYDSLLESSKKNNSSPCEDAELEEVFINNITDNRDPCFISEQEQMRAEIYNVINTLSEKEAKIILGRYGLDNNEEKTLEEIGKELGVTRERIRQIESKALHKLMAPSRKNQLRQVISIE